MREHYIKVLEKMFYSMEKLENGVLLPTSEVKTALAYAISSLKTDLKYDLIYEGEEIYTKDEVIAIFIGLQAEIEKKATEICDDGWWLTYNDIIQQKINVLKGEQ